MKNPQKQAAIDKRRWIAYEKANHDVGGTFKICSVCDHQHIAQSNAYYNGVTTCTMPYEERCKQYPCAKAETKYYHIKNKKPKTPNKKVLYV